MEHSKTGLRYTIGSGVIAFSTIFAFAQSVKTGEPTLNTTRIIQQVDINDLNVPEGQVAGLIRRYTADRSGLNRFYSAPYSPVRRARFNQFSLEWLESLRSTNFESLSQQEKVDYVLFKNHLDHELLQLDIEEKRYAEMESLVPFAKRMIELEDSRCLMQPMDPPKIAALMMTLGKHIQDTKKTVDAGLKTEGKSAVKAKKTVANRAADAATSYRNMMKNWFGFYNGYDPNFTWWVGQPYRACDSLLQDYAKFLREKVVESFPSRTSPSRCPCKKRDGLVREGNDSCVARLRFWR